MRQQRLHFVEIIIVFDYASLNGCNWIVNFVIDIVLMNVFNRNKGYQIISSEASNVIFYSNSYSSKSLEDFNIICNNNYQPRVFVINKIFKLFYPFTKYID